MICGVDEAGRGPVIGPLVVAGVVIQDDSILRKIGVRDSKQVSPKKRETLAKQIKHYAEQYEILVIAASDIDDLRRVMTINAIEVYAFRKVIAKLKPSVCYVDSADVNDIRFRDEILSELSFHPSLVSKHKADELFPIVGAASILAKITRDDHIKKIAQQLEQRLPLPMGSGYPADPFTRTFLKTWVEKFGTLPPHVRTSWKTAQQILQEGKTKSLDEFK
jgi:ribonuclease HII